jgi:hypothetical protein
MEKFLYSIYFSHYVNDLGKVNLSEENDFKINIFGIMNPDLYINFDTIKSENNLSNLENSANFSRSNIERIGLNFGINSSDKVSSVFKFTKFAEGVMLNKTSLSHNSSLFFGSKILNYSRVGLSTETILNLTRFLSSFLGKFLFRSYERSLLAIGYFLGRKENLGFFIKILQIWLTNLLVI